MAMVPQDLTIAAVRAAMVEHDYLGRAGFHHKYRLKPKSAHVTADRRRFYDVHAICRAAESLGAEEPRRSAAANYVSALTDMGFTVVRRLPRYPIHDTEGAEVRSACEIIGEGESWAITILSRGGSEASGATRNPGYRAGLEILLDRLGQLDATVIDAFVDSANTWQLNLSERRVIGTLPAKPALLSTNGLSSQIMTTAASVGRRGASGVGGNRTKRVRFLVSVRQQISLRWLTEKLTSTPSALLPEDVSRKENLAPRTDDVSPSDLSGDEADVVPKGGVEIPEGAVSLARVNRYERNPLARKLCREYFNFACQVCGLRFEDRYSDIGKDYMHVHHKKPLSEIVDHENHTVNPFEDLVAVCPNCHAMIHRPAGDPLSVEELIDLMREAPELKRGDV